MGDCKLIFNFCKKISFLSALQIDFARHALESVRVVDNLQDGLGIIYSDLYTSGGVNTVRNCEFSNNRGSGVSLKQLGLKIIGMFPTKSPLHFSYIMIF